ncbi:MAG: hypothetical protein Q9M28_03130 [Mariprofundaceae bacterium]|nr:hypothetical protein [Mariprofundaceae bacterium]
MFENIELGCRRRTDKKAAMFFSRVSLGVTLVKYQTEFEGYLKSTKLKGHESVEDMLKALNKVSKILNICISSKSIGSAEDIAEALDKLEKKGKSHDKDMRQFKASMQYYVKMMNGL